jgi:hypothetical protein
VRQNLMVKRKLKEWKRPRIKNNNLQRHSSNDLLPLIKPHFVNFPPPLKIAPPSATRSSTHETVGDISYLNYNIQHPKFIKNFPTGQYAKESAPKVGLTRVKLAF